VQTASTLLLAANPNRLGVIISAPDATRVTLSLNNPAVLGFGIDLYEDDPPFQLRARDYGNAVMGPIYAIADTAARRVTVWEYLKAP
jgi:hypothetical protein